MMETMLSRLLVGYEQNYHERFTNETRNTRSDICKKIQHLVLFNAYNHTI